MAELRERRFYLGADKLRNGVTWRRKAKAKQSSEKQSSEKQSSDRLGGGLAVKRLATQRNRMVKSGGGTVVICTAKEWQNAAKKQQGIDQ